MAREINSSKTALQQTFYKILWQITPKNEEEKPQQRSSK